MISNSDEMVNRICVALAQAGTAFMVDPADIVRDNLTVEYTRGGKQKVLGFGTSVLEKKGVSMADEVAKVFGPDLARVARDRFFCRVVENYADAAEAKLLADLTAQGIEVKVESGYGGRRRHSAKVRLDHYSVETNLVSYTTTSQYHTGPTPTTCYLACALPFSALDAPEYTVHYAVHGCETMNPRDARRDTGSEKAVDLDDLMPAIDRIVVQFQAAWTRRAQARGVLAEYRAEFPNDTNVWRPALTLDSYVDEQHEGHVSLRIIAHVTSDKLAEVLQFASAGAPAGLKAMLTSTADAIASGDIGWRQGSVGDDQLHFYTGHGSYDLSLSSRYDRKDMLPEVSTALLVCCRFSGTLPLAAAAELTRHLYSICPEISRR